METETSAPAPAHAPSPPASGTTLSAALTQERRREGRTDFPSGHPEWRPALSVTDEDKFVWAEKYRPNVLNEFICNRGVAAELHQMMEEKTKQIELKGEIRKHIDVRVKVSRHHVELNLSDLHGYEKHVITTLWNESILSPSSVCDHTNCRAIVLHNADKLSVDLQHCISFFWGRYAGSNKFIFCCSDASNLKAVKYLCKVVTLQPPSFVERITASTNNNLRQAIRSLEATWKANSPFIEGQHILTGWEEDISNVARNIMEEPSPKQLFVIRAKIKELIEHDVSPRFIFSCKYCNFLKQKCAGCKSRDATLKMRSMNIEAFADESHDKGETIQGFIGLEEFIVRFMRFYRSLITKNSNRGGSL